MSASQALASPLTLIDAAFSATASYSPTWADGVPAAFAAALADGAALSEVPLLTARAYRSGALPANSLVRYVGMVQDAFDPEFFAAAVRSRDGASLPCAFRDQLPDGATIDSFDAFERRCVAPAQWNCSLASQAL